MQNPRHAHLGSVCELVACGRTETQFINVRDVQLDLYDRHIGFETDLWLCYISDIFLFLLAIINVLLSSLHPSEALEGVTGGVAG